MLTRPAIASLFLLPGLAALAACGSETEPEGASGSDREATCTYETDPMGAAREVEKPSGEPKETGSVDVTIKTNRGEIPVTLDAANAPCAVNSLLSLAGQGYFDNTDCHRLVPGFVLQCGDPSATGMGGPGYSFADELTGGEQYSRGILAMANAGADTNGSQFFIVLDDAGLKPQFTVLGTVSEAGMKVADAVAAEGNGADGQSPAEKVTILSMG